MINLLLWIARLVFNKRVLLRRRILVLSHMAMTG